MRKIQLIVLTLLLAGCHNSKHTAGGPATTLPTVMATDTTTTKLNGTWQLNYITGPRMAFDGLYPDKKPTLIFALPSLEVSGNTSCNSFGCNITLAGNSISFGDARATMMACPGSGEQVFLKALKQVNKYSITGDTTLTMIMGDIAIMRLVKK